jgi:hypothetical protein
MGRLTLLKFGEFGFHLLRLFLLLLLFLFRCQRFPSGPVSLPAPLGPPDSPELMELNPAPPPAIPTSTVGQPIIMESGGPTHINMSV